VGSDTWSDAGNNLNIGRSDTINQIQLFGAATFYDDAASPAIVASISSTGALTAKRLDIGGSVQELISVKRTTAGNVAFEFGSNNATGGLTFFDFHVASGVDYQSAIRRETRENFPTVVLFDPQLYLCGLDVEESSRTCARLATYPFFPVEVPEFDSSEKTQREWMIDISTTVTENWPPQLPTDDEGIRSVIRSALQFQIQFGTSYIILPMPIIENPDEGIDQFVRWIDLGSIEFKELRGEIENTQIPCDC